MKAGFTRREHDLFNFLKGYILVHGYSPSYDEMTVAMNLKSKSGIHRIVHALCERGAIGFLHNRARSIYITSDLTIDLPPDLHSEIQTIAGVLGKTANDVVIASVRWYLRMGRAAA